MEGGRKGEGGGEGRREKLRVEGGRKGVTCKRRN